MTDKLLYCQSDTSDNVRYFSYDSLKAESAKQRFFDAALNNEPCLGTSYIDSCNIAELYRYQLYDAVPIPNKKTLNTAEATASSNVPTGKTIFPQYVEDKYEDLEIIPHINLTQQQVYVPHIYGQIWSQPQHIRLKVTSCGLDREDSQLELMVKLQLICWIIHPFQ